MTTYLVSPEAKHDLDEIRRFIAEDDVDAADRVLTELERTFELLAANPSAGAVREALAPGTVRFLPASAYLIAYHWKKRPIEIVRVVSHLRDLQRLMR